MLNDYQVIEFVGYCADVGANTLTKASAIEQLTPKSMDVLVYLLQNANRTVSIDDILDACWCDRVTTTNVVHKAVSELRKALKEISGTAPLAPMRPPTIMTIHGRGYRLCVNAINVVEE